MHSLQMICNFSVYCESIIFTGVAPVNPFTLISVMVEDAEYFVVKLSMNNALYPGVRLDHGKYPHPHDDCLPLC